MYMNWNQFRQAHKGLSKTEVSDLWKKYKEGEYEVEGNVNATPEEIRVPVGDVEVKIKPGTDGEFGTADDKATLTVTTPKKPKKASRKSKAPRNEVKRDPEEQKFLNKLNVKDTPRTLALKRYLY